MVSTPTAEGMAAREARTETPAPKPDMAMIAAMASNLYALMTWLHEKRQPG